MRSHGKVSTYATGCRCDLCVDAKRLANRRYDDRMKAQGLGWRGQPLRMGGRGGMDVSEAVDEIARVMHG